MTRKKPPKERTSAKRFTSSKKLHQITFCGSCGETIPAKAITCFKCGEKQANGEEPLQVVFCEKCDQDYPARAMACFHCGHINPHSEFLTGKIR